MTSPITTEAVFTATASDATAVTPKSTASADVWARRLAQHRPVLSSVERRRSADQFAVLRRRFAELMRRSDAVLGDSRVRLPELSAINRIAREALSISKLVYAEMRLFDAGADLLPSVPIVEAMLDVNEALLRRVQQQLSQFTATDDFADRLHEAVQALFRNKRSPATRLQSLTRSIDEIGAAGDSTLPTFSIPEWGTSLSRLVRQRSLASDAFVYSRGIETARVVHRAVCTCAEWFDRIELLTLAALLQDVGFLMLESTFQSTPEQLAIEHPQAYGQHIAYGAALVAGIDGVPVDLPILVAQHHERIDGTGFPSGLKSPSLATSTRLLSAAVRFVELVDDFDRSTCDARVELPCRQDAMMPAARQLQREAMCGEFDWHVTTRMLESLDPRLLQSPLDATSDAGGPSEFAMEPIEYRGVRFDRAHFRHDRMHHGSTERGASPVPAPKFLGRQSKRSTRVH